MLYLFFHQIKPREASILEYLVLVGDHDFHSYIVPNFVMVMTHECASPLNGFKFVESYTLTWHKRGVRLLNFAYVL